MPATFPPPFPGRAPMTAFLYVLTVLLWGTTWIAIHMQVGIVPVEVSIVWRFALAAAVLFPLLLVRRRLQPLGARDHLVCVCQGMTLFGLNFIGLYHASAYVTSGIIAVAFSTATLWNAGLARIFFGQRLQARTLLGGALGLAGLLILFWREWARLGADGALGLGLAVLGTLSFSCGNMLAVVHRRRGIAPPTSNAWGMLYGTLFLAVIVSAQGLPWRFDPSPSYVWALLYLAIPGSVVGFWAYVSLVGRIGADRAAYSTVLFPLVALNISVFVEGYRWTPEGIAAVALVIAGNVLTFLKPRPPAAPAVT